MDAFVSGDAKGFTPKEYIDIKLCVETLLSVRAGSQPMDREFGLDYDEIVGYPIEIAKNKLSLEIIEKVESISYNKANTERRLT